MGIKEKMLSNNNEMVETAVRICRGYLNGPWKRITAEDVSVKRVSGGLSNWLYQVRLEKGVASPKQVLIRLYGQTHGEDALESLITESVIFTLLSERKLGPKLHGVFPGGRIEEYIPARSLKQTEMSDPKISSLVATKLASVHLMNVPISKEPSWLWDTIDRWLINFNDSCSMECDNEHPIAKKFFLKDLKKEAQWLKKHLSKIHSPVVFCHNDLQQGNILLREDVVEPSIVFIDFEYCSYNYRGFDLANHLIEWTYDYSNPSYPNFTVSKSNGPSHKQMVLFVENYLKSLGQNQNKNGRNDTSTPSALINEIRHYTMASHFFWGLWSLVNAKASQIPFGYWEYAEERLNAYFQLKVDLTSGEQVGGKRKVTDLD